MKSFVAFVKYMFSQPGVECFLSGKLCQNPLEKFFGCQRQRGGVNENPTVHEFCSNTQALRVVNSFCSNTQALRVVNSFCQDVSRGNCRGQVRKIDLEEKENIPLPKRRKHHKLIIHDIAFTMIPYKMKYWWEFILVKCSKIFI